jgi:predicted RNA-binding Zn-ribbon protein involved in translation (DUF1610 family)
MPNKPQMPPVEAAWPEGSRPTSPPPPRKSGPVDPLQSAYAMIRDLREALKTSDAWKDRLSKKIGALDAELEHMRKQLAKYQCPDCGETDRRLKQGLDPMSGEPVCFECGGSWE